MKIGGKWTQKYKKSINCKKPKGFSQKQYCKYGRKKGGKKTRKIIDKTKTIKKKKTFFKNYDLYSNANPKDTIRIKYNTIENLKKTIKKLEKLRKTKKYSHARIVQVANVMNQRLRVINNRFNKGKDRYKLSKNYFNYLKALSK